MVRYGVIPLVGVFMVGMALSSCAAPNSAQSESTSEATSAPPDTDASAATASPSSSNGADPSGEAIAQTQTVQPVTLVESLQNPWGMAWLPDGTLLVTERPGRLRMIRDGVLEPTPVSGVPEVFAVSQGGLLDVSVHPEFAENQWVYFTYAHGTAAANQTRVARARLDGSTLSDWTVIFEVNRSKEGGQHFGSRIVWLPDNTMLVSTGDGGNPPVQLDGELIRNQAQRLDSGLGKIVRLNDDGSIPTDNPFVGTPEAEPAVWSYGHRNIQGMAIDPVTNQVWATEHGSRGGDELNQLAPGENYGWPVVTHSREYSGGEISSERSRPGMVDPRLVWTPAIAPSGLMVYRGDRFPQWQGHLFAGGLVSQEVLRIELDEAGTVISQNSIAIGQRVRDVRQGPDGLIYILTDEPNGHLIRLEPG
ncbi:MAG: PQQ-dependent sugar dehydrogenase [Leptolyngbya sp. SIO1E4]|nr:PQQ-dependent sugar dehydrogenase [Leptolyngbya sp. SIO1E4]